MKEKLTPAMKAQLLEYCRQEKERGDYWGNQEQFWARHEKIVKWIETQDEGGEDGQKQSVPRVDR
uniref:Uncharacterized protein n=1 Tax=viral metagenome TaxID=1070528 RepID=A0A6M3JDH9_9ZZZZ